MITYTKIRKRFKMFLIVYFILVIKSTDTSTQGMYLNVVKYKNFIEIF